MTQFVTLLDTEKKEIKLTKFTHICTFNKGWEEVIDNNECSPSKYIKIIYLGNCKTDGDMFACYDKDGFIEIYKGEKGDEFEGL